MHAFIKTPSTRSRVFSKTEMFFSEYSYRPHVAGVFRHRKWRFSNTLSRVETWRICVDGRKQRFSNTMTSCLGSRLALLHIWFERRSFFKSDVNVSKIPSYVWTGLKCKLACILFLLNLPQLRKQVEMLSEMGMYTLRYPYFQPSQQLDFGESGVDVMLCILRLFIVHRDRGVGGPGGHVPPPPNIGALMVPPTPISKLLCSPWYISSLYLG